MAIREWEDGPTGDDIRPEDSNKNIVPKGIGDVGTGDDKWRDLNLSRHAHIDGNANIGNDANVTGSASVGGDVVASGAVRADDEIKTETDLWVVRHVKTNLKPNPNDSVDLGTALEKWRALYLSGDANVGNDANVTRDVVSGRDVKMTRDLYVEGQVRTSLRRGSGQNLDLGTQTEKWSHVWAQAGRFGAKKRHRK